MRRPVVLLPAALIVALALAACGGDKAPSAADEASGSPPAAPVQLTATQLPFVLSTPVATPALAQPIAAADRLLGGTPNHRAATLVRNQLKAAGYLLPGIEVYVLPVSGSYEELLVLEIAATSQTSGDAVSALDADDSTAFFKALAVLEFSEIANVTRVVFNIHGEDAGVRSVATIVFPYSAVTAAARGEQASDELFAQLQFEIRPEAAP